MYKDNPFNVILLELQEVKGLLSSILAKPSPKLLNEYYSIQEVADILKIDYQTVRSHILKGNLKAEKIGRFYRIYQEDLEESLQEVKSLKYKR